MSQHLMAVPCRYGSSMLAVLLTTAGMLALSPMEGQSTELAVGTFNAAGLSGWEAKSFKGLTQYQLVRENNMTVVRATSHNAASGLIKKVTFVPGKYRYLRWSWKIDHTIPIGDEMTKSGDDYAARVYVLFPGKFFWQTRAINYIWANHLKKGESIPNAYTSNTMMVAVESGEEKAGHWLNEERDIFADYRQLFGSTPEMVNAIAIMTDTDNTGSSASAWYGDIVVSSGK